MHRNSSIYISILEHKNCKNVNVAIVALDNFFQPYFYVLLSFLCTSDFKMNSFLLGIQVVVYYVLICYKRCLVCNDEKSFKKVVVSILLSESMLWLPWYWQTISVVLLCCIANHIMEKMENVPMKYEINAYKQKSQLWERIIWTLSTWKFSYIKKNYFHHVKAKNKYLFIFSLNSKKNHFN